MERRNFLLTSGTALLGSTVVKGLRRPAVGIEFEISTVPKEDPSNIDSVLVEFTTFKITPQYLDETSELDITVELDIDDKKTVSKTASGVEFSKGSTIDNTEIRNQTGSSVGNLVVDNIDQTRTRLSGEIRIDVDHPDITEKSYKQVFDISENPSFFSSLDFESSFSNTTVSDYGARGSTYGDSGNKIFLAINNDNQVTSSEDIVAQFSMDTPYDTRTATYEEYHSIISPTPRNVEFKDDGSMMYVVGSFNYSGSPKSIRQYELDTAWNVGNSTLVRSIGDLGGQYPADVSWVNNGSELIVSFQKDSNNGGWDNDKLRIARYDAATNWDISTLSKQESVELDHSWTRNIAISEDGKRLLFFAESTPGSGEYFAYIYKMSSAYDLSTLSFVSKRESEPFIGAVSPDGKYNMKNNLYIK